jgi:hypothetical protein
MSTQRVLTLACLLLTVVLVACRQTTTPTAVAYVVIEPAVALFTHVNDTRSFSATAYDLHGRPLDVAIDWRVTDPSVLGLDANGVATARAPLGSTQVLASAEGVDAAPALAWMATPVAGAILIDDAQIVGLDPVDPVDDYDIGWRYRAILSGLPLPTVGSVLIGSGEAPLAGRVVSAARTGDDVDVILELIPLDALFDAFEIDQTIDLRRARIAWDDDLLADFDMVPQPDGSFDLIPRAGVLQIEPTGFSYKLGPLTCKAEATMAPLQLNGIVSVKVAPSLTFQYLKDSAGGLALLALSGSLDVAIKLELKIEAAFEGKLDCTVELGVVVLPLGALGLFVGGQVPMGVGFELNGKVTGATVSLAIQGAASIQTTVGLDCSTDPCKMLAQLETTTTGGVAPKIEGPSQALKLDVRVHAFGYAKLAIGNPFLKKLRFDAFDVRTGPALLFDLAMPQVQADNTNYRSDIRAVILGTVKASSKFDVFLKLLKVSAAKIELKRELVIAQMPTGTFTIRPATVLAGDDQALGEMATFIVELDSANFLGANPIDRIEILWRRDGTNLDIGRPPCTKSAAGQTTYTCNADFLQEHEGTQSFHAFVHVKLFGIPLAIPLEINNDARATVEVTLCQPATPNALRPTSDHEQCTDLWTRRFAEADISSGEAVAIDVSGNIYIAGIVATNLGNHSYVGSSYLAKFSPQGEQEWIQTTSPTFVGGRGVAVDQDGSVYTFAYTGTFSVSVQKHDATGELLWTGTLESADGGGMAVDDEGGVYVVGKTFVGGKTGRENTYFVAKYDALSGELQWKRDFDIGEALAAVVHAGALFVVGQIVVPQVNHAENYVFIAKHGLTSGNQLLPPTTFQGVLGDRGSVNIARAIAARPDGTLLVAGQTNGSLVAGQNQGLMDAFVALFDAETLTRSVIFQFGTPQFDRANGVAWDSNGNAIVVGETFGALAGSNAGGEDAFIARFDGSGAFLGYQQAGSAGHDRAGDVAVAGNGSLFVTGRTETTSFLSKGWVQIGP